MTKLLMILAHPHTTVASKSLQVAASFKASYQAAHPHDDIIIRDLFETPVPALDSTTMTAWMKQKYGQPLTAAENEQLTAHNTWLNEFMTADKYVFVNPMYNHFLPAELKQYIDVTAVARKTFKYTANGPVGLLTNKKALHIQAAGGIYHTGDQTSVLSMDLGATYLKAALGLYGITDMTQLFIEGADQNPDAAADIVANAQAQATKLGKTF